MIQFLLVIGSAFANLNNNDYCGDNEFFATYYKLLTPNPRFWDKKLPNFVQIPSILGELLTSCQDLNSNPIGVFLIVEDLQVIRATFSTSSASLFIARTSIGLFC